LTLRGLHQPAHVDVAALSRTYPKLDRVSFTSDCGRWLCGISVGESSPRSLELVSNHKRPRITDLPLIDPTFGVVGSEPGLSVTSIVVPHANVIGAVFFQGIIRNQTVTELGYQILGSVLRFGFLDLPRVYHETLSTMLSAMPRLEHLELMGSIHQPSGLMAAIEAFRTRCFSPRSLKLSLHWTVIWNLLNQPDQIGQNLGDVEGLGDDLALAIDDAAQTNGMMLDLGGDESSGGVGENVHTTDVSNNEDIQNAGSGQSIQGMNLSYWLPQLQIVTSLPTDPGTWTYIELQALTQTTLKSRWKGDKTKKVSVTMEYNAQFCPREIAFELRANLPWCEIAVDYTETSPRVDHHLAEVNRLLQPEHYRSVESLEAAQVIAWTESV
jgi:hypothetical protein